MGPLRFAFRVLFRAPLVTAVAVLSLALGIGANAAIYSLFDQILLTSLPVRDPGSLVNLAAPGPKPGSTSCNQAGDCETVFSYLMFRDLERDQTVLTGLAAHRSFGANLAWDGQTEVGEGMLVSGSYFPLLGGQPALGRLLGPQDDATIGELPVVVLSHDYWRRRFNEDPGVLNARLVVNGQPLTIVGVAPRGFTGTTLGVRPRVFVPITLRGRLEPPFQAFDNRASYWVYVFGRLKPDVTIDQARGVLNAQYRAILNNVEASLQTDMSEQTLARFRARELVMEAGGRGQTSIHGEAATPLGMLFGVTAVVLLIACANVANLLLARSAARSGEIAVRLSLGASRLQLVRQLLAEACLLALLGGAAGLLVAQWTLNGMRALLPPDATDVITFSLNPSVLLFTAALSVVTGLIFGLFPALHSTRPDLASTLKNQAGQPSGARSAAYFRNLLVAVQVALSMALLTSAGLFTRSLVNVSRVDLGIDTDRLITFRLSPRRNGYTPERARAFFEQVETELAGHPGVTLAAASMVPILSGSSWGTSVSVQGFPADPDTDVNSRFNLVGPGYFRTLGIPLVAGREFTRADALGAPRVAVVNEAFTRKFQLGREAVGKRMRRGRGTDLDIEIVGVVRDAKYNEVKGVIPPVFFMPYKQDEQIGVISFYARTSGDAEPALASIAPIVSRLDPTLPVEDLRTMPQQVWENVFLDRFISTLSAAFAVLATLLAAVGLYGVLAYTVAQRTREFGLRMALGADAGNVRGLVLRRLARLTVIGGLAGMALAVALGGLMGSLLYEMESYDPVVLGSSAVLLAAVALGAGLVPAVRASRIDPMRALRYE